MFEQVSQKTVPITVIFEMGFGSTSRGSNAVKEETRIRRILRPMVDSKGRSFFCTVFLSSSTL